MTNQCLGGPGSGGPRMTPLQGAVEGYRSGMVEVLLQRGCNPNVSLDSNRTATLLHHVVLGRRTALLRILLNHGARPNVRDALGRTPLDWALLSQDFTTALANFQQPIFHS
ncbi:hypothetical protein Micbo1qcDRAFT_167647 [Microdochium bolleyi]|uniref:Uncharacterized protein n=1 Tax=Microdochium bolleyi TaxID=196109 RepID=A0A136IQV3_9PEZI|nr:hypothetical protein Micbo1qcDRAFT_167647 [Microdochium bolleyi]